ncbi:hypothetical protein [Sphingomonas sp. KR3-1]|uniref:hypothetical protein n=1 Tax=Sphingomonas sp. KR3-1 TaxID=3156611 RepID=UPI0032B44295
MGDDAFDTVAIAYSQPQALVILSLFEWNGLLAYAGNLEHARAACPLTLALGGIPIRVMRDDAAEARALLTEAAEREATGIHEELGERVAKLMVFGIFGLLLGIAPAPRVSATIIG